MASALCCFLQSSDHWDKLPFLYSTFIFINLLLSRVCSLLVLGQKKDKECIFKQRALYFRKPVQSPRWEWKHSQSCFDLLCFPETLWAAHIWADPFCLFEVFTLLTDGGENRPCRACSGLAREKPECNRNPMSFPQSFIRFLLQLPWDHFFQPSSFCVSSPEKCAGCGLKSQCHLCSLRSLKREERSRGLWATPRATAATGHRRRCVQALVSAGYLQHLAGFVGCSSGSGGSARELFSSGSGMRWDRRVLPLGGSPAWRA